MNIFPKSLVVGLLGLVLFAGANTLPVKADDTDLRGPVSETERSVKKPEVKQLDIVCIQTAVDKREVAVAASVDIYYSDLKKALSVRREALKAAWTITDNKARATAVRTAWKTFQDTRKTIQKTYRDARSTAWKTFTTDRKACGLSSSIEESVGRGSDLSL